MEKHAIFDQSGKYRYALERWWGSDKSNFANFVLLNPSTADAIKDDPTVRACIEFARRWGFDGLVITNLFAFRATAPEEMRSCRFPNGNENDAHIKRVAGRAKTVVVAWGNHGAHCHRDKEVLAILRKIHKCVCLGMTAMGQPRHPLYVRRDVQPIPFN